MIYVKQAGNQYNIKSKYDPTLIQMIKQVPGRTYDSNTKTWNIPIDKLGFLLNQFRGTMYENDLYLDSQENIGKNEPLDVSTPIPDIDISNITFRVKEGAEPYKHQIDFMKYFINRENHHNFHGFLLCDEQGLAKTASTMNLAIYNREHYNWRRVLIICCVNPAKYHWQEDIIDHSRGEYKPYILGTRIKKRTGEFYCDTGTKEKLEDLRTGHMYGDKRAPELPYFIIMNVEGIRAKEGKKYVVADAIIDMINNRELDMIAIDEVHKNTSPSSMQGKQLLRIKKLTGARITWIPITGTPIVSRPTDAFLPLKLVDAHSYTSYYTWCQQFCIYGGYGDHEILGYKNINKLKTMMDDNMIRRLKKDVLDLPPKIYYTEYVENTPYQNKLYQNVVSGLLSNRDDIVKSLNPLSKFLKLRQVNGNPELVDENFKVDKDYTKYVSKMKRLLELLEEIHERNEKVVIFSNWVNPLHTIYKILKDLHYNCCVYTGTMKDSDREKHKQVFLNNPKYTIMLGTIGALGTMHTLTAANNVIFYDEPWTATDKAQAEDRCHRIGTNTSVNIYTLLSKNTIDERVHNIIYRKEGIAGYIVDNIDIHSNPELFDLLLSDTKPSIK